MINENTITAEIVVASTPPADQITGIVLVGSGGTNGVTAHGALLGLLNDDHPQYHDDARALTWLNSRSTSDLPEGANEYYTDAKVDARIALSGGGDMTKAVYDKQNREEDIFDFATAMAAALGG